MSQIALRGAAAVPTGNPTTGFTVTVPSDVLADDLLYLLVASRDSTGAGTLGVTDNDTGGNAWSKIGNSTDHKLSVWFKRATSATASKTVTVANAVGSSAGVMKCFSGGSRGTTPHVDLVVETNASGDETHAGFTPTIPNAMVCAGVVNYANDNAVTSLSFATLGATTATEKLSTGGSDCAASFGHVRQANGPTGTGNLTWAQTNGTTYSVTWSIVPDLEATASATLGAATSAAAGTVSLTGTTAASLAAVTSTAVGGVAVVATAAPALEAATVDADGTVQASGASGDLDVTLDAATGTGAGTVAVTGTTDASLQAATTAAAGTSAIDGAATAQLEAVTSDADAGLEVVGSATSTLGAASASGAAGVGLSGTVTATLGEVTLVGAAQLEAVGAASLTCGALTLTADGLVGDPPIVGELDVTLEAVTVDTDGSVVIAGSGVMALDSVALIGVGDVGIVGSLITTLGAVTVTATGVSGESSPEPTTSPIAVASMSVYRQKQAFFGS